MMQAAKRYAVVVTLFVVNACASAVMAQDPPAPSMSEGPPPSIPIGYVLADQVDWVPLLSAPPAADTAGQQQDLQEVLALQAAARNNPARRQQAIDDVDGFCFRVADVLGEPLDREELPVTSAFFDKVIAGGAIAAQVVKEFWNRPRPYVVSDRVERLGDADPEWVKQREAERRAREEQERLEQAAKDAAEGKVVPDEPASSEPEDPEEAARLEAERQEERDHTSFPSGHATMGTICGIVLSQMVPEKQAQLFERANTFRESRMILGNHFRTDIENGRALGTAVAAMMSQNFAFQRDLAEARNELRMTLGLPAKPPVREKEDDGETTATM